MAFIKGTSTEYFTIDGEKFLNNAKEIASILTTKGWSKNAISAVIANFEVECTLNPNLGELGVGNPGYGFPQWTNSTPPPSGKAYLESLLPSSGQSGQDASSGNVQLDRIQWEADNNWSWYNPPISSTWVQYGVINSSLTYKTFTTATDSPETLALTFIYSYLRPRYDDAQIPRRMARAKHFSEQSWIGGGNGTEGSGLQLAVLPIHVINVTQSEFTPNFSHAGTEAVDMVGTSVRFPLYAPCDVICMAVDRAEAGVVWQSQREVRRVDGSTGFITFNILHDDTHTNYNVGDTFKKGELFGHTGNSGNSYGDHLHIEASKEKFTTMWQNGGLPNPSKLWHIFSSCDNVTKTTFPILNAGGIPWQCDLNFVDGTGGGTTPPSKRKRKNYTRYNIIGVYQDCY